MQKPNKKEQLKKVQEQVEFIKKLLSQRTEGAEGIMVSIHVVKDGRVNHTFSYQSFPNGDWGSCMIAMGVEARTSLLNAQTGASKS